LAKNQIYHARMTHIPLCSGILNEGDIELKKIRAKENPTDMLTKIILGVKFAHYKELLHTVPIA